MPVVSQIPLEEALFENTKQADSEILESIQRFGDSPPNINTVSSKQLAAFPLLTDAQIQTIVHKKDQEPYHTWQDFQQRTDLDNEMVQWLSQYFTIEFQKTMPLPAFRFECRERIQSKFPKSKGFHSGDYPGNALKYYQRARIDIGDYIQGGVLFEKDPGEKPWNDHQIGYLSLHTPGKSIKVIIGNYRIQTGRGLVLWGPYGTGKSVSPSAALPRGGETIRGYLYSDENRFFTGAAVELKLRQLSALAFYSNTRKDAYQDSLIRSFPISGYHRTHTERLNHKTAHEKCIGGRIAFETPMTALGCTGWCSRYSVPVEQPDPVRQTFGFSGQNNQAAGFDWSLNFKGIQFHAELARSQSGGYALMAHLFWKLKPVSWVILYRNFSPNFQNPYAQGFGYGDAVNERGFYISGRTQVARRIYVGFYMDIYRTPWRTYLLSMPETKSDVLIEGEYRFSSTCRLSARIRRFSENETVEGKTNLEHITDTIQNQYKQQIRLDLMVKPESAFQWRSRLEFVRINRPEINGDIFIPRFRENGFLCFQDIQYRLQKKWKLCIRWTSFETDSYLSRIYVYENDLPGVLNNRPYYKKGTRWTIFTQWHLSSWIYLSLKHGLTYQDGEISWGSGLDEIPGDVIKDFGIQIDACL